MLQLSGLASEPTTTDNQPAQDNDFRVAVKHVSKRYNIYDRPVDRLKEILLNNKKSYHREYWALKDVDVRFPPGITALIGPNGSGKSTLLQIIAGVLEPTQGELIRNGRITAILELGAGFQSDYSGRENVIMNGMILGIPKAEIESRVAEIAAFAELGDFFDQPIKTYSSGMVVRLAFAVAVSVEPDILLVDEALAVGDLAFQTKCKNHMAKLKAQGKTIIFVTHDLQAVREWCNYAILMNGGQVVMAGEVEPIVVEFEKIMANTSLVREKHFTPGESS